MDYLNNIALPEPSGLLEILVLAAMIYYAILFIRGTRGAAILSGLGLVLLTLFLLTSFFDLAALRWLLQRISVTLAVAFLVIFQPEIRRALAELGKQHVFANTDSERTMVEHVVQAVMNMAERKVGALIAIEREIGMRAIQETGTTLDAVLTPELLYALFYPKAPLHDGGVIISQNRIVSAGCLFPLTQREDVDATMGMRHRAALGLSEETDALIVVVSEETGTVSIAYKGHLSTKFDEDRLRRILSKVLLRVRRAKSRLARVKEQLDLTPEGVAKTELMTKEQSGEHGD